MTQGLANVSMEYSCETPNVKTRRLSRPTPKFYFEDQPLSTKKQRSSIKRDLPPRSPGRNYSHSKFLKSAPRKASSFSDVDGSFYSYLGTESYFNKFFTVESKLGVGSFGIVYKVKWKKDGKYYAVKCSKEGHRGERDRHRWVEEAKKLEKYTKHPNCVQFIQAWEENENLYIQTELCSKSLADFANENHDIPENLIWNFLVDTLLALKHLHDHDIIHLDIKPDNIFLSKDGVCKLGDFGLCVQSNNFDKSTIMDGDACYIPKELMHGHFTKAADIFSLGISILELSCDILLPSGDSGWHELRSGNIPSHLISRISHDLQAVIVAMMTPDFNVRPTVEQVLEIPAVKRAVWWRKFQLMKHKYADPTVWYNAILAFIGACWLAIVHFMQPLTSYFFRKPVNNLNNEVCQIKLDSSFTMLDHSDSLHELTPLKNSFDLSSRDMSARKLFSPSLSQERLNLRDTCDIGPKNLLAVFDMASSDEETL